MVTTMYNNLVYWSLSKNQKNKPQSAGRLSFFPLALIASWPDDYSRSSFLVSGLSPLMSCFDVLVICTFTFIDVSWRWRKFCKSTSYWLFLQMCFFLDLKGSEQDLALTRKLLKTKGDMSGKGMSSTLENNSSILL